MRKWIVVAALALAGCEGMPANPIVADYNGASVKIQVSQFVTQAEALAAAQPEADRICRQGGKARAEYASTAVKPNYVSDMLFLCLGA